MNVQFFNSDITHKRPMYEAPVEDFLISIKSPSEEMRAVFETLKHVQDQEEKRRLKEHLYFILPAVITDGTGRAYKNISKFTGLMTLDFDKIPHAKELRDHLFHDFKFVFASWTSSTGSGTRALVKIPESSSVEEFKSYFWGLADEHMFAYQGFDIAPQNACLPMFASYDPGLLMRSYENTEVFSGTSTKERLFPQPYRPPVTKVDVSPRKYDSWVTRSIGEIVDNGHPQVRAVAFTIGGFVGAGRLSFSDAEELLHIAIRNNAYLSKGTEGYMKTASEMIKRGINQPIFE